MSDAAFDIDLDLSGGGGVDEEKISEVIGLGRAPGGFFDSSRSSFSPGFGTDLSQGIGSFDPSSYISDFMNSPFATQIRPSQRKGDKNKANESQFPSAPAGDAPAETGRFGGTFGPKLKKFFKKVAEIHPATAGPMFAFNVMKGLKNSDDPKAFMQGLMKNLAMRKVMGNFGMSSMQRSGLGSLIGVAQGKQNMAQGLGSFATIGRWTKVIGQDKYNNIIL